jgi:hypothetical protein
MPIMPAASRRAFGIGFAGESVLIAGAHNDQLCAGDGLAVTQYRCSVLAVLVRDGDFHGQTRQALRRVGFAGGFGIILEQKHAAPFRRFVHHAPNLLGSRQPRLGIQRRFTQAVAGQQGQMPR